MAQVRTRHPDVRWNGALETMGQSRGGSWRRWIRAILPWQAVTKGRCLGKVRVSSTYDTSTTLPTTNSFQHLRQVLSRTGRGKQVLNDDHVIFFSITTLFTFEPMYATFLCGDFSRLIHTVWKANSFVCFEHVLYYLGFILPSTCIGKDCELLNPSNTFHDTPCSPFCYFFTH